MKNLIVNLWGIGNMIQMEPLMRVLGEGDVLCDPNRSVHELAPLFPRWRFLKTEGAGATLSAYVQRMWEPLYPFPKYDDIYMGFPIVAMPFAQLGNRIHYPVWSFGEWTDPLYSRYVQMAGHTSTGKDGYMFTAFTTSEVKEYGIPKLSVPDAVKLGKTVAVSLGWWKGDGGAWARKNWTGSKLQVALLRLKEKGVPAILLGKPDEYADIDRGFWGHYPSEPLRLSLMAQVKGLAGCVGYLGNDTGFSHIAGALGLPSAVYTVEDKVKVQTAAPKLLQFGAETSPEQAVDWLIEAIEGGEKDGREAEGVSVQGQSQGDPGAR